MYILFLLTQFLIALVIVLCYYKFVETRNIKKYTKDNLPIDLKLFVDTQHINVKKISYKKLMRIVAWLNAVDIGIVLLITNVTDSMVLKLVISFPAILVVIFISYKVVGYVFKKKGMTKDES